ncbi:AAA family ATPase [Streptomyces pactum]|uniref:AAA family ATPase n=1 Tax=Streptomyces pactum TaxID=68249 RepID=A0ABS0NJ80_9ACTN|nr:AAA family ATPase [Streptomyces pactum]MBH5335257.1 AAA family ATPase [Streptomyces pactum]
MAPRTRRKFPYAIEELEIEGYKSLGQRNVIALKALTLIAGVNSSGKSSIMQPLLLLKQTADAPYDPGPLQLDGPNVSVTKIEQVLSKTLSATARSRGFSVGITTSETKTRVRFNKDGTGNLRVAEYSGYFLPNQEEAIAIREGMPQNQLKKLIDPLLSGADLPDLFKRPNTKLTVTRDRFILSPAVEYERGRSTTTIPLSFSGRGDISDIASRIIHLPALRGNPLRTYRTAAVDVRYPGRFDTYTAGIISYWQNNKKTEKLQQLRKDVEELGLTWKIEAKQVDDTQVELLVGRLPQARQGGARDLVNIADVGFGVSQTLPVVVALLAATPGQLVYLEQPEIHLHPRAQLKFAELVRRAVDRGVRVVIETHSSLFLRAVQTLIAQGSLEPDDVAMHWFTRDRHTGETQISTADLQPDGSFGDWPEDFDDVYMTSEATYLNAAMERATLG